MNNQFVIAMSKRTGQIVAGDAWTDRIDLQDQDNLKRFARSLAERKPECDIFIVSGMKFEPVKHTKVWSCSCGNKNCIKAIS